MQKTCNFTHQYSTITKAPPPPRLGSILGYPGGGVAVPKCPRYDTIPIRYILVIQVWTLRHVVVQWVEYAGGVCDATCLRLHTHHLQSFHVTLIAIADLTYVHPQGSKSYFWHRLGCSLLFLHTK